MPPPSIHLVVVKVQDLYENLLGGATVTLTHADGGTLSDTTASTGDVGQVTFNLSDLDEWATGDSITLVASKTGEGTKTQTGTISSGGGQTETIQLAETSDFDFERTDPDTRYGLSFNMLVHYDGEKVTRSRPLPVIGADQLGDYQVSDGDDASDPQYYGFTDRDGKWYIQKINVADGTYRFIRGDSDYVTNWENRATLTFDYYFNIF